MGGLDNFVGNKIGRTPVRTQCRDQGWSLPAPTPINPGGSNGLTLAGEY